MSVINDLVAQIEDVALRDRIAAEVDRLAKQKKFGLVFEEHLPECTPLYDIPVKQGCVAALKSGNTKEVMRVLAIKDGIATCVAKGSNKPGDYPIEQLVTVAEFGEPIYPYLKPIDSIALTL